MACNTCNTTHNTTHGSTPQGAPVWFIWGTCRHLGKKNRLQITITVSLRTHKMKKNVYKKKLFSIYTVYYVYCMYIEAYFFSHTKKRESKLSVIVICNRSAGVAGLLCLRHSTVCGVSVYPLRREGIPLQQNQYTLRTRRTEEFLSHTTSATCKKKKPEETRKRTCPKGM